MKLIVGLGNPGPEYNFTRHNFGFLALDFYTKINHLNWQPTPKHDAIYLKTKDYILIKPQSFYNQSGLATKSFLQYYKIPLENLLILADDLQIPFSTLRYSEQRTSGGNNGLKSIEQHLKTTAYKRLRLGTGNKNLQAKISDTDFVLSRFTPEEKDRLPEILNQISKKIQQFIA